MRKLVFAIAFLAALGACRKKQQEGPLDPKPLLVDVSGCAMLVRGACVLPEDGKIRVFVPFSQRGGDRITVKFEHAPPIVTNRGTLVFLKVPVEERAIALERTSVDGARALAKIDLVKSPRPDWYKTAQELRQQGKLDDAAAQAHAALEATSPADRASAESLVARIELRRGNIENAEALFRKAIDDDASAGFDSDRVDDALALVFMLHKRARRYADARKLLDELAPWAEKYPDGKAREPLYRAQVDWETGDTRAASRLLEDAIERANRIGAASIARAARQVRGMVSCSAGSRRACRAALLEADRELETAKDATACEKAEVAISLGFAILEEMEVTGGDPAIRGKRVGSEDERGLQLLEACPDKYMRAVAAEHLALAALYKNDTEQAKTRLAEAKEAAPEPRLPDAIFWLDVEARIAEAEEKIDDAITLQRRARLLAESSALRTQAWRAMTALGRLLEAKGARVEAIDAYRAAEAQLDEIVALVPLGEGRASAAADGAESMRRLAGVLVDSSRPKEALDVIRHARARLVRTLSVISDLTSLPPAERSKWEASVATYREAREKLDEEAANDWKLSEQALKAAQATRATQLANVRTQLFAAMALIETDVKTKEPPPLPDADTTLAIARVGKARFTVGFVAEKGKVRSFPIGELVVNASRPQLAEKLLAPIAEELERATRVRVLTELSAFSIDIHALPHHEVPLVMRVPVVYGVELGERTLKKRPEGLGPPLVIADPTGDLPSARAEGAAVAQAIRARSIVGREATAARVRTELPVASLLHYAGHGSFKGRDGVESSLPLADGGALSFGDILALPHGPVRVVLSGCETGRREGLDEESSASLAEAFLVAGAEVVIAPVRVVADIETNTFASSLHTAVDGGDTDLAIALAHAQTKAIKEGRSGWEAFRAFVR